MEDFTDGESPLRTIKFRPLSRSGKTARARPLKTIHIAPPPRKDPPQEKPRAIKTIHFVPPFPASSSSF